MWVFLSSQHVLLKEYGQFVQPLTQRAFGFAAGVGFAAVAMPRRTACVFYFAAMPDNHFARIAGGA